ncbi:MAG: hypothetical protein IKD43_01825 [Clostridia bacterium]|nr:hypothetical protein [Clostridia bacterium]
MRFKRAVNLTIDRFSSVFKLFLYRLVTDIIFYSLIYLILWYGLAFIMESNELAVLGSLIGDFFQAVANALLSGDFSALMEFQTLFHTALGNFIALLVANIGSIIGSVLGVAAMYLLQRFVNGLAVFAIGSTVNDRMSVFAKTRFSVSYFRNIGKAALYQLLYVPFSFAYDLLSVLVCWFLFFYVPSFLPIWGVLSVVLAIGLTVTMMIILQAFKMTIVSGWMPAMIVGGMSVTDALKDAFKARKGALHRFAGFLVACYLIVFVNVGFALCTAGSGVFLTVPLSYLFLLSMQFVNYYEAKGKKYFVDRNTIAEPEEA